MPCLEYTLENRAGVAVLCQLLLNRGAQQQERREGKGKAWKVPTERVTMNQHLIFIKRSKTFPLLRVFRMRAREQGTRQ